MAGVTVKTLRQEKKETPVMVRRVRSDGTTDYSCDVACDRCGEDDPTTERERPTDTKLQWLCSACERDHVRDYADED